MNWSVWGAPIAVLAVGVLVGLVLALRSTGRGRRDPTAELAARKDALVDQLRALGADQGKLSAVDFEHRWKVLLDDAARALRDLENWTEAEAVVHAAEPDGRSGWARRAVWGVVILFFFVGLGATLQTASHSRVKGGTMTGGSLVSGSPMAKVIADLEARVARDAGDLEALNRLAHIAISGGDLGVAMGWMDKARALAPDDPEVRTHMAVLQISVGMAARATAELEAALKTHPEFSEALFWSGVIALREGDREAAIGSLERALEHAADSEARLMATQALAEARKPPPTVKLTGTIGLGEGVGRPGAGVLFVMVRRAAGESGPPVAAVRLDPRGVPGSFAITDRDIMMGGPWPDEVWVEARLDGDGDPSTTSPTDLKADLIGPFQPGAEGVSLVLEGRSVVGAEPRVGGQISLGDGAAPLTEGAIFVIVRRSSTMSGPPVAAVRLDPRDVPGTFAITDRDIMMGGPWPEEVWIHARADADANAMTKEEGALTSPLIGPIAQGSTDLELILRAP